MARYYQSPKNDLVDLTPRIPVEFYSKLIEQAQQNLNQANATSSAFMSDAYGQKFIDEASRNKAMELAQAPLSEALDKEFVTPATIARAVGQASQAIAPWQNINAKHLEQAKREQELRDRWGSNYIGNSVMSQKLMTPEGNWINPDDIKLIAGNTEDAGKLFDQYMADWKNHVQNIEGGLQAVPGNPAFLQAITTTYRGMTPSDKKKFMESGEWKRFAGDLVPLMDAVKASGQDPMQWLEKNIDTYTNQLVQQPSTTRQFVNNPNYKPGGGDDPNFLPIGVPRVTDFTTEIAKTKEDISNTRDLINYTTKVNRPKFTSDPSKGTVLPGLVNKSNSDSRGNELYINPHPTEKDFVEAQRAYNKLAAKYPQVEAEVRQRLLDKGDYPKDPLKFRKLLQNAVLDELEVKASKNALVSDHAIDFQDASFEQGLSREIALNVSRNNLEDVKVYSTDGSSTTLGDLYTKDWDKVLATPNASGTFSLNKEGKTYIIPTHDEKGVPLNIVNNDASKTSALMGKVFSNRYKYDKDSYEPMELGYSIPMNIRLGNATQQVVGYPIYKYNNDKQLLRAVLDANGEPYKINGEVYWQPMDLGEFQMDAGTALYYQLNIPNYKKN